jgi:cation diffusion facilitator family transporter
MQHLTDPGALVVRDRQVRRVILIEGAANLAVLVAKTVVGLATGSMAVLGDAVHSLADLGNNGLALFVMRLASAPPDREHPYGHRKFETLAVFALATLLAVLAIELVQRAFLADARVVVAQGWSLVVMLGVLGVNAGVSLWEARWARRLESDLLRADARHTLSDVLVTSAVIAGWQLGARGWPALDSLATLAVAALIVYLAWDLFRRSIPVLTDRMAADPEELAALVRSVPGVRQVRRVRSLGAGAAARMDVVVGVDPRLSTAESHAIADAVEQCLRERHGVGDVTVHVEPGE